MVSIVVEEHLKIYLESNKDDSGYYVV